MNPLALWIVCFVLGAGDALLTGLLGVIFGGIFFVLALPLAVRGDRASAMSGLLLGFGATWLALMGRQSSQRLADNLTTPPHGLPWASSRVSRVPQLDLTRVSMGADPGCGPGDAQAEAVTAGVGSSA